MPSEVLLFRLCINYVLDTIPNIIDLSGQTPYTLSIDIARPRGHTRHHPEAHSNFINVVIDGSVFDVSSALQTGQLSLVKSEGDYPKIRWRDRVRRDLPKDIFHEQFRPDLNIPKPVRINPRQLARPTDPQRLVCSLNPAIVSVFNDQHLYRFKYPPTPPDGQGWGGGISWRKLCPDPSRPPDTLAPMDQPHAKVRRTTLPVFKAMANPSSTASYRLQAGDRAICSIIGENSSYQIEFESVPSRRDPVYSPSKEIQRFRGNNAGGIQH